MSILKPYIKYIVGISFLLAGSLIYAAMSASNEFDLTNAIELCNQAKVEKCEEIADKYDEALGVEQDYGMAALFYYKACDLESGSACRLLAWYHEKGYGVNKNTQNAQTLYIRGCQLDDGQSCASAGSLILFAQSPKTEQDNNSGLQYLLKACDKLEMASACHSIGFAYDNGKVIKQDKALALKYYSKACNKFSDKASCYSLGLAYDTGHLTPKNPEKSQAYYKKSCTLGDDNGCAKARR